MINKFVAASTWLLLLNACGSNAPKVQAPPAGQVGQVPTTAPTAPVPAKAKMAEFTANGYELSGGEYWPYVGSVDVNYPDEVLWGFYPEKGVIAPGETTANPATANPTAVACAERAFAELQAFIASDPPLLRSIAADAEGAGYDNKFYLWTNDYTKAADPFPPGVRPAKLWYWKRREAKPDRPPGFWKWESTLDQKGVCHTPNRQEADAFLKNARAELDALAKVSKACRGTKLDGDMLSPTCQLANVPMPPVPPEATVVTGAPVGVVRKGKPFKIRLTVTSQRALPVVFGWRPAFLPRILTAQGEPLPGTEACGVGGLGNLPPAPVFALDSQGAASFTVSLEPTYNDCEFKKHQLAPGSYRASWATGAGDVLVAFTVVK